MRLDSEITVERKSVSQDSNYGTETITWIPLVYAAGSPQVAERFPANVRDVMPSRSESVAQGLAMARNQTRVRIRWRADVTSDMRVVVHGDSDVMHQIVGGPAEVGGRQRYLEMVVERYSS